MLRLLYARDARPTYLDAVAIRRMSTDRYSLPFMLQFGRLEFSRSANLNKDPVSGKGVDAVVGWHEGPNVRFWVQLAA